MRTQVLVLGLALSFHLATHATAQCGAWSHGFGYPGVSGDVSAMVLHDDGSGPELFVASASIYAGEADVYGLTKWNGTRWASVGATSSAAPAYNIYSLASFDDGTGSALYAGGAFSSIGGVLAERVAKWNGTTWSAMGSGLQTGVYALEPYDDGNGAKLYAAGNIYDAGGTPVQNVVVWNGVSWQPVGSGLTGYVNDLQTYDDGSGAKLYAVGEFTHSGAAWRTYIAAWDGATWTDVGGGLDGYGWRLAVYDDGAGPQLYVSGLFANAGAVACDKVARWNGSSWSAVGSHSKAPSALHVFDDGSGSALYAGYPFTNNGGSNNTSQVERFRGGVWSALAGGPMDHDVKCLASYDAGGGAKLFVGGSFATSGGVGTSRIARWTGSGWTNVGGNGVLGTIYALGVHDAGTGPLLYAGGDFYEAGSAVTKGIAAFDGTQWSAVGGGVSGSGSFAPVVRALLSADLGNGRALYVAGAFQKAGAVTVNRIAKWDGAQWSALGAGLGNYQAYALCVYDDGSGPKLYVGGDFLTAGGATVNRIARWNGLNWSAVAGGVTSSFGAEVSALAVHDEGSGAQLYVGGEFSQAGAIPATNLARWNGASWSAVTGGVWSPVHALASWADAQGPALYVGGQLMLARLRNGASTSLANGNGAGSLYDVRALAPAMDAGENVLYAAGLLSAAPGGDQDLMRWNGSTWSTVDFFHPFPASPEPQTHALALYDSGSATKLYIGGLFYKAGSQASFGIAARQLCGPLSSSFCPGNGGSQACPCGGSNAPGAGCANSTGAGAVLANVGSGTSVHFDDAILGASHLPPHRITVFAGSPFHVGAGTTFYAGLMCLAPPRTRLAITSSDAQGAASLANVASAVAGLGAGTTWNFQVVYRDAALPGCSGTLNTTNGIAIVFAP